MIKAIMFDLDDTLLWDKKSVDKAFNNTCNLAFEKYRVDPVELEKNVRENARKLYASYNTYSFTQMIGINPFEGLWADFDDDGEGFRELKKIAPAYQKEVWISGLKDMGIDDLQFGYELAETFPEERKRNALVFDDTFHVLEQLKGKYQLLLLTNGSPSLQEAKLDLTPELRRYFDHIVISGAFGKGKPDPDIFMHALGLLSVDKEEVLMVGDNLKTDILGASRTGIASVWINRHWEGKEDVVPDYEISQLEELLSIIEKVDGRG
ncbi:HAD family hydrolase [Virgibacillus doumboii]|uniref:HAD family hydrolase n=1 Tax=Virgibacillus doumboii TaxID=2697503 RepID=UPI0013DF0032|nr:HAD family hydrolase [Virgibacillus doumboii]